MGVVHWMLFAICLRKGFASYYHQLSMKTFKPPSPLREDAFFGYSITYDNKNKTLIASAPRADGIGQIFACDIDSDTCTKMDVMSEKDIIRVDQDTNIKYTHDLWLGATVKAGSDFVVMCAPRYTEKNRQRDLPKFFTRYGSFGRCLLKSSDGLLMMQNLKAGDRVIDAEKFENTTDSFGWSVDVTVNDDILVGSPAMSNGRVVVYNNPSVPIPKMLNIRRQRHVKVSFNFGYSIASGNFFSNKTSSIVYAVGTTYGEYGYGKILFYNSKNNGYISSITDDSVGSMFAAALCSAQLSGGTSDLLVGAPAFAPDSTHRYDVGAVHIYSYNSNRTLKYRWSKIRTIFGEKDGSYFGSAIISVGDLDNDNRDEVAIAAPYENDGSGVVYIYSGEGLLNFKSYLQKIQSAGHRSFGLSLTALNDYDNNGCNELAIGSPGDDSVMLLRCMATITIKVNADFSCLQKKRDDNTFFVFQSYINVTYPEKPERVQALINVKVDIIHSHATLANPKEDNIYSVMINEKKPFYSRDIKVLTPEDGDYDEPIEWTITAVLADSPLYKTTFNASRVVLSHNSVLDAHDSEWVDECKGRMVCEMKMDVNITSSMTSPYMIGSTESENVKIRIRNEGDTVYKPCVRVYVIGAMVLTAPGCTRDVDERLTCLPQKPVLKNGLWETGDIALETNLLDSAYKSIIINVDLYYRCKTNVINGNYNKTIDLVSDSSGILIKGATDLGQIVNLTKVDAKRLGKKVEHVYTITNNAITNWVGLKCDIILEKKPYIEYTSISIYTEKSDYVPCKLPADIISDKTSKAFCDIGDLQKKNNIYVVVTINVLPKNLENILNTENVTIHTQLDLFVGDVIKTESVTTIVKLQEARIPLWIIIVAGLVGLLILFIIAFALHECGFLRRKNKEKLTELKKDIKRQSMRRSMITENVRAANRATNRQGDCDTLLGDQEENETADTKNNGQHQKTKQ